MSIMFDSDNTITFLVASDIHLGYKEGEAIGNDAFVTFEEIFEIAKKKEVDFVLLGGDLFHKSSPSKSSLHAAMETMRKHCLGNGECKVKIVSDQTKDFGHTTESINCVNYEDPKLNISMPVFSIHGNHDDTSGKSDLSAIDIMSVSGFINHFGKCTSVDDISIKPVLLQKGSAKMALYGLSSIREEWLHQFYQQHQNRRKIELLGENKEDWCNVMVLHQNRSHRGKYNYKPEHKLDGCLDLVIWGHEHESIAKPVSSKNGFSIIQTGSTVVTQMKKGECKKKQIAIVKICGKNFHSEEVTLETPRQAYYKDINLSETGETNCCSNEEIRTYLEKEIENIIEQAQKDRSGHSGQSTEPRIRLKVDATNFPKFVTCRFPGKFVGRVVNHNDIVKIKRTNDVGDNNDQSVTKLDPNSTIEDIVKELLLKDKNQQLDVFVEDDLVHALKDFVYKSDKDAMKTLSEKKLEERTSQLKKRKLSDLEKDFEAANKSARKRKFPAPSREENNGGNNSQQVGKKPRKTDTKDDVTDAFPEVDADNTIHGDTNILRASKLKLPQIFDTHAP